MALNIPNVDDSNFDQLMAKAREFIRARCPNWTDLSPNEPGIVLVELFAHMTEMMIYKLNQLPEKAYIEFLELIGTRLLPPTAASVDLVFTIDAPKAESIKIPLGTQVSTSRSDAGTEPPVFVTSRTVEIVPGETSVNVLAHHCDYHEAEWADLELVGSRLIAQVANPPIVGRLDNGLDLIVGVRAGEDDTTIRGSRIDYESQNYVRWQEVDNFNETNDHDRVYTVDRVSGTISFAPSVFVLSDDGRTLSHVAKSLGNTPELESEVRVWYRNGGGVSGNVAADSLTVLKDVIQGVNVTNPLPASGGRNAESLENALVRGPQELFSLQRAITSGDYQSIARTVGGVSRATANSKTAVWKFAKPGTVDVLLVPSLPDADLGDRTITRQDLEVSQAENVRAEVERKIKDRQALGVSCEVRWVDYKSVNISARIAANPGEDADVVRLQATRRLNQLICPVACEQHPGWQFGMPLRLSAVYDSISENGNRRVDQIKMHVTDGAPDEDVTYIVADPFQKNMIFAASRNVLFRSTNSGVGWEPVGKFGEATEISNISPHPKIPGVVAICLIDEASQVDQSQILFTENCGQTWSEAKNLAARVRDMAWTPQATERVILLATDSGLFEMKAERGAEANSIPVSPHADNSGFFAVTTTADTGGWFQVAVSAQNDQGVFLSKQGGQPGSFQPIGLQHEDVRLLAIHFHKGKTYLWAGLTVSKQGCARKELGSDQGGNSDWQFFENGWVGESCRALAFDDQTVYAATYSAGIIWTDVDDPTKNWEQPNARDSGLPIRGNNDRLFTTISTLTINPENKTLFAGCALGTYKSTTKGRFESCCRTEFSEFSDSLSLPAETLFCSGEHKITVVSDYEEE